MNSFKPGDWVRVIEGHAKDYVFKVTGLLDTNILLGNCFNYKADHCKLWIPKQGEWVVIADDITPDLYAVFQFNNHSKDRQILPLAFLQTLKDQS